MELILSTLKGAAVMWCMKVTVGFMYGLYAGIQYHRTGDKQWLQVPAWINNL